MLEIIIKKGIFFIIFFSKNNLSDSEYSEEDIYSETDESSEDEIARIKVYYCFYDRLK